jgi:hypothetical protein
MGAAPSSPTPDVSGIFSRPRPCPCMWAPGGGGGYDAIAWLMARHMSHFLPGNPNFVIKNMPTAAGGASANVIYNSAPRPQFALRSPEGTCSCSIRARRNSPAKSKGLVGRVEEGRGSLGRAATPRFPSPLIKPDVRISRIRLSDRLHRRAHGERRFRLRLTIELSLKAPDPIRCC